MAQIDTRFRTYLNAFFADLLTGMSGPMSVPFAALALWVSNKSQKVLWACLAVLCGVFASYRVWRNERMAANEQIERIKAEKDTEIAALRQNVTGSKSEVEVTVRVEGEPPEQAIKVIASERIMVSRVEYMLSNETCIVADDVRFESDAISIPLKDALLVKVWNTPRADMSSWDHSGPAKLGLTISLGGKARQYILPIRLESVSQGSSFLRKVIGSKVFVLH